MNPPTEGEVFEKLSYHLVQAQEAAATLAHLTADNHKLRSMLWLDVSEKFRLAGFVIIKIAKGKLQ